MTQHPSTTRTTSTTPDEWHDLLLAQLPGCTYSAPMYDPDTNTDVRGYTCAHNGTWVVATLVSCRDTGLTRLYMAVGDEQQCEVPCVEALAPRLCN